MSSSGSVLPGARVRSQDGFIGTVERLEQRASGVDSQPDSMVVRSEDGLWRYSVPLMLVRRVSRGTFHNIVDVAIGRDDLTQYIVEEPQEPPSTSEEPVANSWGRTGAAQAVTRIPLAMEELVVHKRPVVLGKVHIHKDVETVEQHYTVPVHHEEAIVEHIPPSQYDGLPPADPSEVIIPILEEHLVVTKKTVVKEYLRVRKQLITRQQEVRDTVRREAIQVTEQREDGIGREYPLMLREEPAPADQP